MSTYQYQALNKAGKTIKGLIDADSERQARQQLREQNLVPTHITLLTKQIKRYKNKISAADLSLITRQLATLLAAGISVEESLTGVIEQTEKNNVRELMMGVRTKVREGYSLAQGFGEFPLAFPELYRATVGAGEQTGRLDIVLEKLALYTESQQATRHKIQQALIYPSLMIFISVVIISFLLAFVVPKIIEVFTSSGQSLPQMTLVLITLSHIIQAYGVWIALGFIAFLWVFKRALRNIKVKLMWHTFLLKLPISSYLVKSTNVARYIHTFGILFAAGVSILETMRVSGSLVNNLIIRKKFDEAAVRVKEGTSISHALKMTGFVNPMALHLIGSGEKSGQIAPMMDRAASHMDSEVKRLIDSAMTLMEPVVILLMGGVVLFIVLATLLPIFSMEQLVS